MPDTSWMKEPYSVRVIVHSAGGTNWYCWTTPAPVQATSEEALEMLNNVRSKVQSFLVNHRSSVEGFLCYERDQSLGGGLVPCIDECIIPATVLASSIIRYTLVKHSA